jgi:hypothetical protein
LRCRGRVDRHVSDFPARARGSSLILQMN